MKTLLIGSLVLLVTLRIASANDFSECVEDNIANGYEVRDSEEWCKFKLQHCNVLLETKTLKGATFTTTIKTVGELL